MKEEEMYIRVIILSICAALVLNQVCFADQELRRRGFAGFGYRSVTETDMDSLDLTDMNGVFVTRILQNTPAERAGIQKGDVIRKYDGNVIVDVSQLLDVLRLYYAGDTITVSFLRDGKAQSARLVLEAFPEETSDEVDIEYTSFTNNGIRFRAVITSPLNSDKEKLPALLLVSALRGTRLIGVAYYNMYRDLAYAVAKKGFRVMRFELRDFGDSEGEDFRTTDFYAEVSDNRSALDYLMNRDDVDKEHVFVMGHSTGGMIAGILASKRDIAGLITSCTVGRTYYERLVETLRIQGLLGGDSPAEIDETIKCYLELTTLVARGDSLSAIIENNPNLTKLVNSSGRIMDDRNADYWRQQLNLNLSQIYSTVKEPVLIVYASSDFLTQLACHEHIQDVLTESGNEDIRLEVISNCDHAYAYARDKKESYENYKTRDFEGNPEPVEKITEWLLRHVSKMQ